MYNSVYIYPPREAKKEGITGNIPPREAKKEGITGNNTRVYLSGW